MRGRKPRPRAAPTLKAGGLPRCPPHLSELARKEWRRLARPLFEAGILTLADRAAFAAYCQAWGKWAEAEAKLREGPILIRTPSGYVQQTPWISIANKQVELMGRYMSELGITPTSRSRLAGALTPDGSDGPVLKVLFQAPDGTFRDRDGGPADPCPDAIEIDPRI